MINRIDSLPVVLTSFAYHQEYISELDGLLATIKEHHPMWPLVIGRGPIENTDSPAMEVETPLGKCVWTLPISLASDGSTNDFLKIVYLKGWWVARVWSHFCDITGGDRNRILWTDADARFNGPLDVELDPNAEVIAGPWWVDPDNTGFDHISGGLLLFQGAKQGRVGNIIDQWSKKCLSRIQDLPPEIKTVPESFDQEVLTELLVRDSAQVDGVLIKLDFRKYAGCPAKDGRIAQRGLVDHWYMNGKMMMPEWRALDWPPPEEYRRTAAIGTPLPGQLSAVEPSESD